MKIGQDQRLITVLQLLSNEKCHWGMFYLGYPLWFQ